MFCVSRLVKQAALPVRCYTLLDGRTSAYLHFDQQYYIPFVFQLNLDGLSLSSVFVQPNTANKHVSPYTSIIGACRLMYLLDFYTKIQGLA